MPQQPFKPRIGITTGDLHGIGCEVIIKALQDAQILQHLQAFVYAPPQAIAYYCRVLSIDSWHYETITTIEEAADAPVYLVDCTRDCTRDLPQDLNIQPGMPTKLSAQAAWNALDAALRDVQAGHLQGLATGPIAKHAMQDIGFSFVGHTEYLAQALRAPQVLMMMVSAHMRMALASTHVPLLDLRAVLSAGLVEEKVNLLFKSLESDFGIMAPRVALLGLNPHAGEEGRLSTEEQTWFLPLVARAQKEGKALLGPYAADGFFAREAYRKVDAVLAMYHDQGLIPFKMLSFDTGVNYTAGLPIVRVSPDHGTAFDIAGKNRASARSMCEALRLSCQLIQQRKNMASIKKG